MVRGKSTDLDSLSCPDGGLVRMKRDCLNYSTRGADANGALEGKPGCRLPYLLPLPSCVGTGNYITSLDCFFCKKKKEANIQCLPPRAVGAGGGGGKEEEVNDVKVPRTALGMEQLSMLLLFP